MNIAPATALLEQAIGALHDAAEVSVPDRPSANDSQAAAQRRSLEEAVVLARLASAEAKLLLLQARGVADPR